MEQEEILRNISQFIARQEEEKKKMLCLFEQVINDADEECDKEGRNLEILSRGNLVKSLYRLLSSEPRSEWEWINGKTLSSQIDHYIAPSKTSHFPEYDQEKEDALFKKQQQVDEELENLYKEHFQDKEGYDDRFYYPISVLLPKLIHNKGMLWHSIEEDTLPLIDLLDICKQSKPVTLKSYGTQPVTIDLNSRSASLLSSMISEYLKDKIRDFHKVTTPSEMKELLLSWHREKVDVVSEKYLVGKFLCHWLDTIKWEDTHTITDKRNIVYSIGAIVGLYEIDESKDRKERADFVKNKINSYLRQLGKK